MEESFEPRKVRDFGEIINDTFVFIFKTWKPLLKAYATICGFFVIGSLLATLLQQFRMMKGMREGFANVPRNPFGILSNMLGFEYIVAMLFSFMTYTVITLTTLSFIHLYREKGNEVPTVEEVWTFVKFYFFQFLGSGILMFILFFVGFMFCLVPGIYLYPIISLIFPIMLIESTNLGFAFSKAFTLIKGNWWATFGVQAIMLILITLAGFVFYIPMMVAGMGGFFTGIAKMNTLNVVLKVVIAHINMAFFVFPNIAIALSYYSLSEQKDGTGLMDRIKSFGKKDTGNPELAPEEY
ncbi:hypothetical protein [Daejeonella lutea]|uniref:Membrane domain of glycerophosphoryl diester phosphodiesterase n=1 Tax=Daejeonella lutea TaxID=572036 RepID=A0A1T5BCU8_9SPHI|nr:hypothetical protein [Daejeonella lutea]SKB45048.1 hypothetical protein SAMN05661099_1502 [Daejeonella lutea]